MPAIVLLMLPAWLSVVALVAQFISISLLADCAVADYAPCQVPGDGRELVVMLPDAVKVSAEDGRRVEVRLHLAAIWLLKTVVH
jgi:hypothetical protein